MKQINLYLTYREQREKAQISRMCVNTHNMRVNHIYLEN